MFLGAIHVVVASLVGAALLAVLGWFHLVYESIPNLVTIEEAQAQQPYDYIIVGAGTVGAVLANRLSAANANISVLLIEAGNRFGLLSAVPLLALFMQKTAVDWSFVSTPQQHSTQGQHGRRQFLPRGKGLGGSSQLNYALHSEGSDADFEAWERAGATGWGAQTMRRYLQKVMRQGEGVEQRVFTTIPEPEGLVNVMAELREEMSEAEPHLHFDSAPSNTRNGIRWSTYHTYLRPAFQHPNLHILCDTRVHRVEFDATLRATGVSVAPDSSSGPQTVLLHSRHEIVLSAGAYQTPQLLQLSGIGGATELRPFRIPVLVDLPAVGRNLHEHLTVPLYVSINESLSLTAPKLASPSEWWRYLRHGGGFLARFGVIGFVADPRQHHALGIFAAGSMEEQVLREVANTRSEVFRANFPLYRNQSQEGFVLLNSCHRPRSRGRVALNGRSVRVAPLIDPNFLAAAEDVQCVGRAIRMAVRMLRSRAMQKIGVHLHWPRLRECGNFGPFREDWQTNEPSDRYLECVMRMVGVTAHHPGGTCAIGECVDAELRIRGVRALRVVDASLLPSPVSGTPNTVLMAIGERAADLILAAKTT